MKSIHECMAIGRNFKESFQKAVRSLSELDGLNLIKKVLKKNKNQLLELLRKNLPNKFLIIAESIRKKISIKNIVKHSQYDSWFINGNF